MLAMARLPTEAWLRFANGVVDLHEHGAASEREVMETVIPIHGFYMHCLEEFANPGVRKFLYRVEKVKDLSKDDKYGVAEILTGLDTFVKWISPPEIYR